MIHLALEYSIGSEGFKEVGFFSNEKTNKYFPPVKLLQLTDYSLIYS